MQQPNLNRNHAVNYYDILGLPPPLGDSSSPTTKDQLKTAYHQTLLVNHPDKALKGQQKVGACLKIHSHVARYSIDEIMRAFQTLADPKTKAEYDKQLLLGSLHFQIENDESSQKGTHLGVEDYDLEDLEYDEQLGQWFAPCRCGDETGYKVTDEELEKESKAGEVYVGCRGCSLFIKVLFALVE